MCDGEIHLDSEYLTV